jgi:maltose-binding protein MalE
MIRAVKRGETRMTLPTNEDFANCELSAEELDAVAAGWPSWVHSAVHGIEDGVKSFFTNAKVSASVAFVVAVGWVVASAITGGGSKQVN